MTASLDPEYARRVALIPPEFAASIASIKHFGQSLFEGSDLPDIPALKRAEADAFERRQLIEPFTQPSDSDGNRAQRRRAMAISRKRAKS